MLNEIKTWDVGTGKGTTLLIANSPCALPLIVFSPDGKRLASGGRWLPMITLWDVATGRKTGTLKLKENLLGDEGVLSMAFTPDGKTLVSSGDRGEINLWDVATGKNIATIKRDTRAVGY
jgi:WD40 repeat protein